MKKVAWIIFVEIFYIAAFGQTLSLKYFGNPFQCTNLVVHWNISTNTWPRQVWIYRVLPNEFSPNIISNLMLMCSLTEKDKKQQDTNGIILKSEDGSRILSVSFSSGSINYYTPEKTYSPTNLAKAVPSMNEMPELTKNFLKEMGVNLSDIEKKTNGVPDFRFWEPYTWFFTDEGTVTNVAFRAAVFSRSVDGMTIIGKRGEGTLYFGEHGKISKVNFSWPTIQRYKLFPTASPEKIVDWIRKGKGVQGPVSMNVGYIDWSTVRSVTVTKIWPSYYAGEQTAPSNWLMPYLALGTSVDTGNGNVDVEIDCPIIGEIKP